MARGEKLLERMRRNPRDWRIEDVVAICEAFAIDCSRPSEAWLFSARKLGQLVPMPGFHRAA